MKKFIIKICIVIIIPYIIGIAFFEYKLRQIPNEYAFKNDWLTKNASSVEVFTIGSSPILCCIDPQYINKKTFNTGHLEQSHKYDCFIFNKFMPQMDSLKYVVLSVSYNTLFDQMEGSMCNWRVKKYAIYYGCNFHKYELNYNFETYDFSLIEGNTAFNSLLDKINRRISDQSGYGIRYSKKNQGTSWKASTGGISAINNYHILPIDSTLLHENLNYLNDIFKACKEKNITVMLLVTPVYYTFYEAGDPSVWNLMYHYCHDFEQKYPNVHLYDYLRDNRFTEDDFYDTEHLNEFGAKKFSLLLNDEIEKLENKRNNII